MISYDDVYALLMRAIPDGIAVSLPVPTVRSGKLYDLFFTYSVDYLKDEIERPIACYAVYFDEGRAVDIGDAYGFSAIRFENAAGQDMEDFFENLEAARALYGQVRDEAAAGERGEATKRYFELVGKTSQPCLLPYYRALGAEFDD